MKTKNIKKTSILKAGFTLIELLVVISIIGILIGLSIFGLQGARESSRDSKRKTDLEAIRSALEIYKSDCSVYPTGWTLTPKAQLTGPNSSTNPSCLKTNVYIVSIPGDPTYPNGGYSYVTPDAGVTYSICAHLEQVPSPLPVIPAGCNCDTNSNGATCNYVVTNP